MKNLIEPKKLWKIPQTHFINAINDEWYRKLVEIENLISKYTNLFYIEKNIKTMHLPITTGSISSCRFFENGVWYIMPSFRGESEDKRHLSQFYHSEAEIIGDLDDVMNLIEKYIKHLSKAIIKQFGNEIKELITKKGGLVSHLDTSDARDVVKMISEGNKYAKLVYDAMIYQIAKAIGSYSVILRGQIDAIILTGGIARDEYVVSSLKDYVSYLGEVVVMPGEKEMEALANGALRVLRGEEEALEYTGIPVWQGK